MAHQALGASLNDTDRRECQLLLIALGETSFISKDIETGAETLPKRHGLDVLFSWLSVIPVETQSITFQIISIQNMFTPLEQTLEQRRGQLLFTF